MRVRLAWAIVFGLVLSSCGGPWRAEYLREARDHATQEEVAQRLGKPNHTRVLQDGTSEWRYECHDACYVGQPDKPICVEYLLAFDRQQILRKWVQMRCEP